MSVWTRRAEKKLGYETAVLNSTNQSYRVKNRIHRSHYNELSWTWKTIEINVLK